MSRLPTLEDLAKRIAPSGIASNPSSSASTTSPSSTAPPGSRPRLPQSILANRTSRDSESSKSPSSLIGDEPPVDIPKDRIHRGYKNVPSLDAIASRLRAKSVSANSPPPDPAASAADGVSNISLTDTNAPPEEPAVSPPSPLNPDVAPSSAEPAPVEPMGSVVDTAVSPTETSSDSDPNAPHPLQHTWTLFHDSKSRGGVMTADATQTQFPDTKGAASQEEEYAASLTVVSEFETVEDFCRWFNWLKPPSQLEINSNYHLFKKGIRPMWEDEANANGGKWVLTMKSNPQLLDRCWSWLAMALVGEELDERDEICGAVVSLRTKLDRIQLWTRSKDDAERINSIGKRIVKLLDVGNEPGIGFEFQYHSGDRPARSRFISIAPASSGFHRAPPAQGNIHGSTLFGRGSAFGGMAHAQPRGSTAS